MQIHAPFPSSPFPRHPYTQMRDRWTTLLTLLAALGAALPLAAQEAAGGDADEPRYEIDLESTSHVVRREEDRLLFRYHADKWDFEGLAATLTPRFRDDRDQIGLLVARAFDWGELTAVARLTDKPEGGDTVAGVRFVRASAASTYGAEVTWGQADLRIDDFLVGNGENQLVGRVFWRRENGLEVTVFGATSATFDLMRGTAELLERFPRSEIAGAETLADLYVDEGRLEDSAGVAVDFGGDRLRARLYAKSGDQTVRGFVQGDDFLGFGGELRVEAPKWSLATELDLRRIDPADGFGAFERGRFLLDFRHRPGRFEWGVGGYVQGEAETYGEIPDVYDTAGLGATLSWQRAGGRRIGFWVMWENDAPDIQVIARLAAFYRSAKREYGVGLRRDEIGPPRFVKESYGPFFFLRTPFRNLVFAGDLGVQDGEVYGKLSLAFKR